MRERHSYMLTNAFIGKPSEPTESDLAAELGASKSLWKQLLADLEHEFSLTTYEWNSYSIKAGWALRIKHKARNIVYLTPSKDAFMASFILGDKAIKALRANKPPKRVLNLLAEGKRYPEGTSFRIDVLKPEDLDIVKEFVRAKLAH